MSLYSLGRYNVLRIAEASRNRSKFPLSPAERNEKFGFIMEVLTQSSVCMRAAACFKIEREALQLSRSFIGAPTRPSIVSVAAGQHRYSYHLKWRTASPFPVLQNRIIYWPVRATAQTDGSEVSRFQIRLADRRLCVYVYVGKSLEKRKRLPRSHLGTIIGRHAPSLTRRPDHLEPPSVQSDPKLENKSLFQIYSMRSALHGRWATHFSPPHPF